MVNITGGFYFFGSKRQGKSRRIETGKEKKTNVLNEGKLKPKYNVGGLRISVGRLQNKMNIIFTTQLKIFIFIRELKLN